MNTLASFTQHLNFLLNVSPQCDSYKAVVAVLENT